MERLLDALALFSITLIVAVLGSVRRAHIRVEYSVAWLGAAIVLLILSRSPRLFGWLVDLLGVSSAPAVAPLLLVMGVFLVVFYRLSLRVSDLKDANIALSQRIAILEYKLYSLHEERKQ